MYESDYNQPPFKSPQRENPKLNNKLLKSLGFTEQWSNSLDMYVYQKEDVVVYETMDGYKYDHTGTILITLDDLQDAVFDEYGEYLEY